MDDEALRAMMPLSFGKKGPRKAPNTPQQRTSAPHPQGAQPDRTGITSAAPNSAETDTALSKKRTHEAAAEEFEDDDGLTAEEREANAAIERNLQQRGSSATDSEDDDDEDDIGPQPADTSNKPAFTAALPPMTNEAVFTGHHTKTISALAVDQSGARFCIGSYDYSLSFYDFGGMNAALAPFRSFEPAESYPVYDLSFSADSRNVLVVSGTAQAKVFSRDGVDLGTCKKGDPYLRDMRNTTGHVSDLSCGKSHPIDAGVFITGGSDSTVRLWDLATMERGQTDLIVLKSKTRGNRTKVTSVQYSSDGTRVFAAALDGSLAYWDTRSNLNAKPRGAVESAHTADTVTSSIAVNALNTHQVATRGGDHTVKLWDLRNFKSPIGTAHGLTNTSAHTDVLFNPVDGQSLLTCVSSSPLHRTAAVLPTDDDTGPDADANGGKIVVLSSQSTPSSTLDVVQQYAVSADSPVRLTYCEPTNQLYTTFKNGSLRIFYDTHTSIKGITLAVARHPTPRTQLSSSDPRTRGDPHTRIGDFAPSASAEPAEQHFGQSHANVGVSETAKRRKLAKLRQDPLASHLPQRPISGPGKAGRIGTAFNTHLVSSTTTNTHLLSQDPREALLKYASPADKRS